MIRLQTEHVCVYTLHSDRHTNSLTVIESPRAAITLMSAGLSLWTKERSEHHCHHCHICSHPTWETVQIITVKFQVFCSLHHRCMKFSILAQVRALNIFRNAAIDKQPCGSCGDHFAFCHYRMLLFFLSHHNKMQKSDGVFCLISPVETWQNVWQKTWKSDVYPHILIPFTTS